MNTMPVVIRHEYLTLMNGDHCAAAILNAFEMWSKNKADFIYKSAVEMQADLMGLFGLNRIGEAFKELRRRGFLLARKNPYQATDQTLQYLFQPVVIQRAMLLRQFLTLNLHALKASLQTLFLKSQALSLKHESESISETKSEGKSESDSEIISDSRERDFEPEGIDQSKFVQDDPYLNAEGVPQYLRQQVPSAVVRQQLAAYSLSLGLTLYAEVMTRCANARSWEYVLKALANEPIPSPGFAAPPSPAADDPTEPDWTEDDIPGNETPAIDIEPNAQTWSIAVHQLEAQLGYQQSMWFRDVSYSHMDGGTWVMRCPATAREMLQHRLYREIRRVLRDVRGEVVELRFEAVQAAAS